MSVLEPDAPAPHVFPHAREAIRAWWGHRNGKQPTRAGLGAVRGKGPLIGDTLRVGRMLRDLGLLGDRGPSPRGRKVIEWALGMRPRTENPELQSAILRVERWGRKLRIVAEASPHLVVRKDSWLDVDGNRHDVTYHVDSS